MEFQRMANAPIAFTLTHWQQTYRDGQSPAELLHSLRLALSTEDNAWIALASEAQLNSQLDALSALLDAANGELSKLPLYGGPLRSKTTSTRLAGPPQQPVRHSPTPPRRMPRSWRVCGQPVPF